MFKKVIIADYLKIDQKVLKNRFIVAIPLFIISFILTNVDFQLLWRYFSWANQVTASIALWVGAVYLYQKKTSEGLVASSIFNIAQYFWIPEKGYGHFTKYCFARKCTFSLWLGRGGTIIMSGRGIFPGF